VPVGFGRATGEVIAGCMGSSDRISYTVIGEEVNLASRLCAQARPGQILLDAATTRALGGAAETRPLPPLTLKGIAGAVEAFELVAVRD
jgi:class 3 adenylate cyclase